MVSPKRSLVFSRAMEDGIGPRRKVGSSDVQSPAIGSPLLQADCLRRRDNHAPVTAARASNAAVEGSGTTTVP